MKLKFEWNKQNCRVGVYDPPFWKGSQRSPRCVGPSSEPQAGTFLSAFLAPSNRRTVLTLGFVIPHKLKRDPWGIQKDHLYLKQCYFSLRHQTVCFAHVDLHFLLSVWEEQPSLLRQSCNQTYLVQSCTVSQIYCVSRLPSLEKGWRSLSGTLDVSWGPNSVFWLWYISTTKRLLLLCLNML